MKTSDILREIDIPRERLYYLEFKGYINPKRVPMGEIEARVYSQNDLEKIRAIWKYLQQGFKYKIAYAKALEELSNPQLNFSE